MTKKTKILALANRKGGVGKTTSVVHLATGLADLGLPVVAMDLDPQGNLGEFLGLGQARHVAQVLNLERRLLKKVVDEFLTRYENYPSLRVVLGDKGTKEAENGMERGRLVAALRDGIEVIGEAVAASGDGRLPLVILDTAPGLGYLQLAALEVAHFLIIPINPSFASETGLPRMAEEISELRDSRGAAQLLGILPTRYKSRTTEHQTTLENLAGVFGEEYMYPTVRDTVRLEEAPGRGVPVWDYDPQCAGAMDYARVLVRLTNDLGIETRVGENGGDE